MSYYWFNRQEILQKAKERYSKEKAAEYYLQNKKAIKEKARERYKNLSQEEKDKIKEYQKKRYQELVQYKKMNEKTLKFESIMVNKKSKHPIDLSLVSVDKIVVSDKFRHSDEGLKYFIGYKKGEIVKLLCIILPQMNGDIKYFDNGSKNMLFFIRDDKVLDTYNEIWDVIKSKLGIKFHSEPIYDKKYIKAKVREFDGVIKTNFLGNKIPKENLHYTCIACVTIDSVVRMDEKNYPEVYLEECKYKIKKIHMPRFMNAELESESDPESESDAELIAKLE